MPFPDISHRHRRLVRTTATLGSGALSLVRRHDFAPEHQDAARFGNAVATAGLSWLAGTSAFMTQASDLSNIPDMFGAFEHKAGQPARYSSENDGDERTAANSQSILNAAVAGATGLASWALWTPTQRLAETIDSKLPSGAGRGLSAAASGGLMALSAVISDKIDNWANAEGEVRDYGPVEIELPAHIRSSVKHLLSQPHPISAETAEVVRGQFDSARFFVWVTYSNTLRSGSDPITLTADELSQLLEEDDVSSIDVYPSSSSQRVVPAMQTYPVIAFTSTGSATGVELSLDIADGRLNRLQLSAPTDDSTGPSLSDDLPPHSLPGTLHPNGLDAEADHRGYWATLEITDGSQEDEILTLARWPQPSDLTIRTDRE